MNGSVNMEMNIHLHEDVFEIVKNGTKDIEVRINDEKRRKLHIGDTLIFLKRPLEDEQIKATVTNLEYYTNFEELINHCEMKRIYLEGYTREMYLKEMSRFYTEEEQKENGVVAIYFKKTNKNDET